ncbi:Flagellar export protein FliJ [uncultured delta proteobacterium]|uniref:Flagellar FliJ protein n=1 Tax=uncultured delta proteobacterium TaxID=34034 RepID=A0A212KHF0_9DELT|nr:Flagellar export protein FliJ [uncultured delta proteobacterium]
MSVFKFSLEQVLSYRAQLEEQAMQVFSLAVQARDKRLREKEEYEAAVAEARRQLADPALLDADERWLITGYIKALAHDIDQARNDLAVLEEDVDRARADLTQKAQDKKLLERLKEKQATRHRLAENHKEQQNYDDIATIRFMPPAV